MLRKIVHPKDWFIPDFWKDVIVDVTTTNEGKLHITIVDTGGKECRGEPSWKPGFSWFPSNDTIFHNSVPVCSKNVCLKNLTC